LAETITEYLLRAGLRADGGLRFVDRNEQAAWVGWGEVRQRALAVAGGLRELGLGRGERVAMVFPTGVEFFAAFFGALLAGGVPVPLYPPVRLGRLREYVARTTRMLAVCGARVVLADPRVKRFLGEAVATARPRHGCRTLADLPGRAADGAPGAAATAPARPDELALIQFSSGTTMAPKAVALSHRAIVAQTEMLSACWLDREGLRHSCASWLPLYHDMGLIGCVFPALARDATLNLLPPELFVARPALWLRAISRYGATISPAPNFGYSLCLSRVADQEMDGVDLSCWRAALNGAEPVAPAVLHAFGRRFARWGLSPAALTPVYGLSEAALAVTFSDLGRPYRSGWYDRETLARERVARRTAPGGQGREIVSVGKPLPGFRLSLRDGQGRELPAGRVGRLWVSGPSLMEGYLGDAEGTARALRGGWLDTGDLGFLDGGELYLTGRAKDLIILRGRNYSPAEIEQAVDGLPGVRAGCAVAVSWLPDGAAGEVLALFVERSRQATAGELAALPAACGEAVLAATGLAIDRLEVLAPGTLPRTSSGKLRRSEALRLYLAGRLAPPAPVTPLRLAQAMARSSLAYARWRLVRRGEEGPA
jgi:acyl-CoA synthetase (AMP-forming)/AMP-acid ligase II